MLYDEHIGTISKYFECDLQMYHAFRLIRSSIVTAITIMCVASRIGERAPIIKKLPISTTVDALLPFQISCHGHCVDSLSQIFSLNLYNLHGFRHKIDSIT